MRSKPRRAAILACSIALNIVLILSPVATTPLLAARCQQDCDALDSACTSDCTSNFSYGSPDWTSCVNQCGNSYNACSMSAVFCYPPHDSYCGDCWLDWDPECVSTNGWVWMCVTNTGCGSTEC